jgi:hypothetical protein
VKHSPNDARNALELRSVPQGNLRASPSADPNLNDGNVTALNGFDGMLSTMSLRFDIRNVPLLVRKEALRELLPQRTAR